MISETIEFSSLWPLATICDWRSLMVSFINRFYGVNREITEIDPGNILEQLGVECRSGFVHRSLAKEDPSVLLRALPGASGTVLQFRTLCNC